MAIVKTMIVGTAIVHIDDSCYRDASAEEIERRKREIDRAIWMINRNHARRVSEQQRAATEQATSSSPPPAGATSSVSATRCHLHRAPIAIATGPIARCRSLKGKAMGETTTGGKTAEVAVLPESREVEHECTRY